MLRKMFPRNAPHDSTDSFGVNTKLPCQATTRCAFGKSLANIAHLRFGQPRQVLAFSSCAALAVNHIARVIAVVSQVQMLRVYTRRVITAMQHPLTLRYRPISEFVCHTMRLDWLAADVELPVSAREASRLPKPAAFRTFYLRPKQRCDVLLLAARLTFLRTIGTYLRGITKVLCATFAATTFNLAGLWAVVTRVLFGYTSHVNTSYQVLAVPRVLAASLGFAMSIIPRKWFTVTKGVEKAAGRDV